MVCFDFSNIQIVGNILFNSFSTLLFMNIILPTDVKSVHTFDSYGIRKNDNYKDTRVIADIIIGGSGGRQIPVTVAAGDTL